MSPRPTPRRDPLSVVLVDDNQLLCEGLTAMIDTQQGLKVLAASAHVDTALEKVRESRPAVVLVNSGLAEEESLRLTAKVRAEVPDVRVIVTGVGPNQEHVSDFVRAGASGFILRDASFEDFCQTIHSVAAGKAVVPPALSGALRSRPAKPASVGGRGRASARVPLTCRERQVTGLLAQGLSNKAIAGRLGIAVDTVKSHVHSVLRKLAVGSRLAAVALSYNEGPPSDAATARDFSDIQS